MQSEPKNSIGEEVRATLHPVAQQTLRAYKGNVVGYEKLVMPRANMPHVRLNVSEATLERATRFLGALASKLEARGFEFVAASGKTQLNLRYKDTGISLEIALREKRERHPRELKPGEKIDLHNWDRSDLRYTGRLCFQISDYLPNQKEWSEAATYLIDERIDDIVAGCLDAVSAKQIREQEFAEQKRQYAEQEKLRAEIAARKEREEKRRRALAETARAWVSTSELRAFRSAAEQKLRERGNDALSLDDVAWLEWVDNQIAERDPLAKDFVGIMR